MMKRTTRTTNSFPLAFALTIPIATHAMRLPLKYQLLLPWLAVTLATVAALSLSSAWLTSIRVRSELRQQLRSVATTLVSAQFPIEDSVLSQASGLTGARFAVVDPDGKVRAVSDEQLRLPPNDLPTTEAKNLELGDSIKFDGERYFQVAVALDRRPIGGRLEKLWIFYPERVLQEARWQAIWPPLFAAGIATLLLLAVTTVIAARVTRPIEQLGRHAEDIALGEFEPIQIPERDDEIRDLVLSINRMTAMLAHYEDEVRRNERLRTLGQLGGGIAHQIRNAVTGCRMALDLHQRESTAETSDDEPLTVARRQLELMENYLQRFLTLGRPQTDAADWIKLSELIAGVVQLVRPTASHLGVALINHTSVDGTRILGDQAAIEQMLVNLVLNAIEAASSESESTTAKKVEISLIRVNGNVHIDVADSGPGVPADIKGLLFQPFATSKPDGVGLGLSVARDIARSHQGDVVLAEQSGGITCFRVILPLDCGRANAKN